CTTIGAPPPIVTPPTFTAIDFFRSAAAASVSSNGTTLISAGLPLRAAFAAAYAQAGDFQHRRLRAEARGLRGLREIAAKRGGRHLRHRAAALAQHEENDVIVLVSVGAGEKRILAFDPVRESFGEQKLERAVNRHRGR